MNPYADYAQHIDVYTEPADPWEAIAERVKPLRDAKWLTDGNGVVREKRGPDEPHQHGVYTMRDVRDLLRLPERFELCFEGGRLTIGVPL